jgi:hypothetical protein
MPIEGQCAKDAVPFGRLRLQPNAKGSIAVDVLLVENSKTLQLRYSNYFRSGSEGGAPLLKTLNEETSTRIFSHGNEPDVSGFNFRLNLRTTCRQRLSLPPARNQCDRAKGNACAQYLIKESSL